MVTTAWISRTKTVAIGLFLVCAGLSACGPRIQPLEKVTMGEEPLKQIASNPETFKQIPQQDLQILIAYLAVNEKARLEGAPSVQVQGKGLLEVIQDSRVWQTAMKDVLEQAKQVAATISSQVLVAPVDKVIEEGDSPIGKARIMKISYQVDNKSTRAITGVQGNMRYFGPDGGQLALIQVVFDRRIEAGGSATMFGHSPVLVGSRATPDMVAFAEAPIGQVKFEFLPLALRYEDGEIVRVPAL
jgi:hypothetical protein